MKICWLDLETTGLDSSENEIVQLSCIIEENQKPVDVLNLEIRPDFPERTSEEALEKQGRTIEELLTWMPRDEAFAKLIEFLDKNVDKYDKNDKLYIAGYNVAFDVRFLRSFFEANNHQYYGSYFWFEMIDVMAIIAILRITGSLELPNMRLETVCEKLGMPFQEGQAHDSLWDIRRTRQLFYKLEKAINIDTKLLEG
jgi:DNA polymerase-3 subunit epsilon